MAEAPDRPLPAPFDFWVLDRKIAAAIEYDDNATEIRMHIIDKQDLVAGYLTVFEDVAKLTTPHKLFYSALPQS